MRPVDSHCHLQFEQFDEDREKVVDEVEKKLDFGVLAGINPKDNQKTVKLSKTSESLKYCLGLHPLHYKKSVKTARNQIKKNNPVAVGEIGLDYNYITDKEERRDSEKVFREMLNIAENQGLPVVVHSRNAEEKCFDIVNEYEVESFFHCFNGRPELAEKIASSGHMVGVTNQVTHSTRVQNIVEKIRVESILTETDSPYLSGDRNRPVNVLKVVEKIADIKGLGVSEVMEVTSQNSENFFG